MEQGLRRYILRRLASAEEDESTDSYSSASEGNEDEDDEEAEESAIGRNNESQRLETGRHHRRFALNIGKWELQT